MSLKRRLLVNVIAPALARRWYRRNRQTLLTTAVGVGTAVAARAVVRRLTQFSLRGKTVLITGGSRGLGLVLAREFARQGARLAICARDAGELARARVDLVSRGAEVVAVPCDLTDQSQVREMIRHVREQFKEIDVLVNNAGIITVGPYEEMTLSDYEEAMKANFWSALYTTLAVAPEMRARRQGRIVNIASIGGKIGVPHLVPYCASKFALVGFSEGLRAELKPHGVVVTTVCPGLMRTGSPLHATFKGQHREEYKWFSVSDSLPLTSMSAERAARRIVTACKNGDAEVILSIPAKLAVELRAHFPELTAGLMGLFNYLLPDPGGIGVEGSKGAESGSALSSSWLTVLSQRAARKNNQIQEV
ncbi:MAG TPA: SDR family NAD(P)-dependent oxidoreductase [Blastocatellia bacterium]|nr:SDR family NAD(P)-dependent oxidoreductase [Blastocatellia bacterium]